MASYEERNKSALRLWYLVVGALGIWLAVSLVSNLASPDKPDPKAPPPVPWTTVSVPPVAPYTGPLTLCRDGTVSHSAGRGTCSHHGGEQY